MTPAGRALATTQMVRRHALPILFLLLLALAPRLMSPPGFMPGSVSGTAAIIVCPDQLPPPPLPMHHHAHHPADHHQQPKAHSCDFAAVDHDQLAASDVPPLLAAADIRPMVARAFDFAFIPYFARWHRPPPTGPPILR